MESVNGLALAVLNDKHSVNVLLSCLTSKGTSSALRAQQVYAVVTNVASIERNRFARVYTTFEISQAVFQVHQTMLAQYEAAAHLEQIDKVLRGRKSVHGAGDYVVVPAGGVDDGDKGVKITDFRVINVVTGAESALYPLDQCIDIVRNALDGKLLGSFDL